MITSDRDFDWWDREVVAVPEQHAVAVYRNERDEVVIRQWDWPDDDTVILVAIGNARAVAEAILREAGVDMAPPGQLLLPTPRDPTAAERQRKRRAKLREENIEEATARARDIASTALSMHRDSHGQDAVTDANASRQLFDDVD